MNPVLLGYAQELMARMVAEIEKPRGGPGVLLLQIGAAPPEYKVYGPEFGEIIADGHLKDQWFDTLRYLVTTSQKLPPANRISAIGFASEAWIGQSTDKGAKLVETDPAAWDRLVDKGFETLFREGYITRGEAVQILAQNKDVAIVGHRRFVRSGRRLTWVDKGEFSQSHQSQFGGRMKMFGDINHNMEEFTRRWPIEKVS